MLLPSPTPPTPVAAPTATRLDPVEQRLVDGMQASRVLEQIARLGGPRVAGTEDARRAAELIRDTAAANGWSAHLEEERVQRGSRTLTLYNVVADKAGTAPDGERRLTVAGAHLDTVPGAPGANDDGSGSAALLEATRLLASEPTRNDVRFVWFDGEELGMLGAQAYVRRHGDELGRMRSMIEVEMLGSPLGRPRVIAPNEQGKVVGERAAAAAQRAGIDARVKVDAWSASDHLAFARAGVPAIAVASTTARDVSREDPAYHKPGDTIAHLDPEVLERSADLVVLAINAEANA